MTGAPPRISPADFLALNREGIDLFIQMVDQHVANTGQDYRETVKALQHQIHEYIRTRDSFQRQPSENVVRPPMKMKLGRLLDRRTCNDSEYNKLRCNVVYILRDGEQVMYVGSTRYDARNRVKSHERAHSPLGKALRENPATADWDVEIIPHANYRAAFAKEKQLIAEHSPAFCRR